MNKQFNPRREVRCPSCNMKLCDVFGECKIKVKCSKCREKYTAILDINGISYRNRFSKN